MEKPSLSDGKAKEMPNLLQTMTELSEEARAEAAAALQRRRAEYESEKLAPLMLPEGDAQQLLTNLKTAIEERYGYKVECAELEHPKTGIFDGLTITLHPHLPTYLHCFILLHLFGHSVQWTAPSLEHKLHDLQHTEDRERFMQVLHDYELEAARFGMQLLHELKIEDRDQWYSDFVETDLRYVERFYREGTLPKLDECVVTGCPLIEPLNVPEIKHRKVAVRFAF
jgi:hypothetical protein